RAGSDVLFPGADTGLAVNHGTPEDIINLKPDLIVAGDFSTPMTRRMARKVGARLVELKRATSFADVRASLRKLGAEVGEPARAAALRDPQARGPLADHRRRPSPGGPPALCRPPLRLQRHRPCLRPAALGRQRRGPAPRALVPARRRPMSRLGKAMPWLAGAVL